MKTKKKLLSALSIVCAFAIIFGGVFAFFSDSSVLNETTKVGTVNIEAEGGLIHSDNLNNLNPGDNDTDVPEDYRSGTDHELSFEIDNLGNKSVIYRTVIEVSAVKSNNTPFTAEELMSIILSEKQNVTTVTTQENIASSDTDKYDTVNRLEANGYDDNKLVYIVGGTTEDGMTYVLNGTGEFAETETGVDASKTSTVQTFDIGLDKDIASELFEGATITFNVAIQAIQYRNTGDPVWDTIYEESYTTGGIPETDSDEFQEVQPTAFAVYSETDKSLTFYKNYDFVEIGDTYNDKIVTDIFYGFETETYKYGEPATTPWTYYSSKIQKVVVQDKISPISTDAWFSQFYYATHIDVTNLDTSNVTSMSYMFADTAKNTHMLEIVGMDTWDTSKVVKMNSMFMQLAKYAEYLSIGNIGNWDTSSVEDMSNMFWYTATDSYFNVDLSGWNTSNVKYMNSMFYRTAVNNGGTGFNVGDISKWDVHNVTTMSSMFAYTAPNSSYTLDLSGWNVNASVEHDNFNANNNNVISPWD